MILFGCNNCDYNKDIKERNKMKIAVICANGKAGRLIVKEGVARGLEVTAGCARGK